VADEETPQEEQPKRPRRRARKKPASESDAAPAVEAANAEGAEGVEDASDTRAASPAESASDSADEIEPTAADEAAEDEAADVVLEAEAEIDADSEPEAEAEEKPKPRRRRAAAEPKDEPAPEPAPTRRQRPARDPNLPPPEVRAHARYVRSSARKARLVCDHIRGKSVGEARAILAHTPRAVARDWSKLLESAIANAENNHELVGEDLYVKAIHADEGPTIKRFRPRAMGRATRIRKRTSHLTILLTPKD
jgi:large subunit ribosomal protein L22